MLIAGIIVPVSTVVQYIYSSVRYRDFIKSLMIFAISVHTIEKRKVEEYSREEGGRIQG
jgi:hypothetical protein